MVTKSILETIASYNKNFVHSAVEGSSISKEEVKNFIVDLLRNCGDHYECNNCYDGLDPQVRVEGHCMTGGISRKGYLEWVKKYRNPKIKI